MPKDEWRNDRDREHQRKARSELATFGELLSYERSFDSESKDRSHLMIEFLNGLRTKAGTQLQEKIPVFRAVPKNGDRNVIRLLAYGIESVEETELIFLAEVVDHIGSLAVKELFRLLLTSERKKRPSLWNVFSNIEKTLLQLAIGEMEELSRSVQENLQKNAKELLEQIRRLSLKTDYRPQSIKKKKKPKAKPRKALEPPLDQPGPKWKALLGRWVQLKTGQSLEFFSNRNFYQGSRLVGIFEVTLQREIVVRKASEIVERWGLSTVDQKRLILKTSDGVLATYNRVTPIAGIHAIKAAKNGKVKQKSLFNSHAAAITSGNSTLKAKSQPTPKSQLQSKELNFQLNLKKNLTWEAIVGTWVCHKSDDSIFFSNGKMNRGARLVGMVVITPKPEIVVTMNGVVVERWGLFKVDDESLILTDTCGVLVSYNRKSESTLDHLKSQREHFMDQWKDSFEVLADWSEKHLEEQRVNEN